MVVKAAVRPDATADSTAIVLEQLRRLCDEPSPNDELQGAKSKAVGNFALRLEQPSQVNQSALPALPLPVLRGLLGSLSREDKLGELPRFQAVAQKYLAADRARIVAVGDAARIRPALEKLGKVEA
jgi:predicted Zn-dependent peptidase